MNKSASVIMIIILVWDFDINIMMAAYFYSQLIVLTIECRSKECSN